ncbi:MAG: tRNA-dihydrouridine synthase [Lachnospiraceae bacterium]
MDIYFAPMEGITGFIFRQVHHTCFPGIDKYYTPFVVATQTYSFKTREKKDVAPENNPGIHLVPQIMANKVPEFLWTARTIADQGYEELNLNLGCPMQTVVSKKKGAGFLSVPDDLNRFLDGVFSGLDPDIRLSIKTRIGMHNPDEWGHLLEIYNQYPIYELTIHPRTRDELYKGKPHVDMFKIAMETCRHPLCYNGNIYTAEDHKKLVDFLEGTKSALNVSDIPLMIGRGLIANPALARQLKGGPALNKQELKHYHDSMYQALAEKLQVESAIHKMKEIWTYMQTCFEEPEKPLKAIKKARKQEDFQAAVDNLFAVRDLKKTMKDGLYLD